MGGSKSKDARSEKMNEIVILAGAQSSLLRFYMSFEDWSEGLGDQFHAACERAFRDLSRFPEIATKYAGRFRRCLLIEWNLALFYTLEGNRIIIYDVIDIRQDPTAIKRQLGLL